jgi:hypothetical protein
MPTYGDGAPPYGFQPTTTAFGLPTQSVQQPQSFQPPEPQFNWDDINLNNIEGSVQQQNQEMPEFDWVSVG